MDVRTTREYETDHILDAVNVPLLSIMKNPYVVSAERCLMEAGYRRVSYFAGTISEASFKPSPDIVTVMESVSSDAVT